MDFANTSNDSASFKFSLEDTTDKSYRDIASELLSKGWSRVVYKKRSKLERKRLPAREQPNIIWTLNEKDIDFVELKSEQGCNHYENITSITTKRGYCDLLRELHWYSEDSSDISPRCYNLGDPIHRDEFIDDFRLVAAINILKWFILHIQGGNWCRECGASTFRSSAQPAKSSSSSVRTFGRTASLQPHMLPPPPPNGEGGVYSDAAISKVVQGALIACLWHIRIMKYGEWPEVDISRYFKDRDKPLDESQWCEILDFSYDLADMKCAYTLADLHEAVNLSSYGGCSTGVTVTSSLSLNSEFYNGSSSSSKGKFDATFNAQLFKVKAVLQCMSVTHPQLLNIDGCKNIWVIKAPDSSCGIGIKLHSRLDDILQSERGMGGRTVQKYVEFPLLAPIRNLDTAEQRGNNCTSSGCDSALAKFDMRVWVLVTSFQPLRAHIFSRLYGRRCGSEYSSDLSTLADNYAHLTNYSVQKKQQFSLPAQAENEATSTSTAGGSVKIDSNSARKLRRVVSGYRARNASTGNLSATGRGETDTPAVPAAYGVACCASAKRLRVAESDLLMSHNEIVNIVRASYVQYQTRTDALARNVVRKIGSVEDVWAEHVWPLIRSKISITLQAAQDNVVHRHRSFEFLGYDVIIDAALEPWILEVNMSPAMAHRTPEQSRLIASMSRGLLALAVFPHFPTLTVDDEDNDDDDGAAASGFHAPDCDSSDIGQPGAQAGAPRADYGEWEVLCAASSSTAAGCGTAETTGIEGNLLAVASDKEPEPQPEAAAAQAMEVTLGDWDEVEPPEVTARKATRRPSSALHRKYSGIGIGTGTGTDVCNNPAAPVCGNSQVTDPYFQKFVLAASAITAPGGTAVGAGNAVRMEGNALINPGGSFGNFMAVGVAISETAIATTDKLCDDFHKLLVLQQWWRRFLLRSRSFHSLRNNYSLKIQSLYRRHRARLKVHHLRRNRAAVVLQSFARKVAATTRCQVLREARAATVLQKRVRGAQGRAKFALFRRKVRGTQICRWILRQVLRKRVRAVTIIVLRVRKWVQRRFAAAKILQCALKFNYLLCRRCRLIQKKLFGYWFREYRVLAIKRRSSLKSLSRVAAQKAQSLQHERALALDALVQRTETALMSYEEECMHRSVAHEQAADLAEELVTELLDAAWAAIRKVRLSQKKLHRKSPTSPAKTPAKDKTELDAPEDFKIKSPTSALFASDTCWPAAKEAQDVTPIAEYLSQQFTQAHRRKPTWTPSQGGHDSKADRDVDPALPPVFQARDEFQFTGDDLLQNIIAKSTSAFLDSVVQYAPTEPTSTEAQATVDEEGFSPHNHLHHMPVHAPHRKTISSDRRVGHPVADRHSFVSQHHGEVKRDRSVTMTLQRDYSDNLLPWDLSCSDAPQADPQEFFAAPNPAWSSTAPTNAPISRMPSSTGGCVCRPRSRVIQRPNVDYDGQNARVAESSVPRSESGQFAHDRPSQAVGREHFQSAAAALSPGATLNAAIEQASLLNMQNILGRQSGRPDASVAQVTQAGLPIANHHYHQQYQQGSYVYPSFDQSNGGGSEFTGSAAASARSEELNPLCRYLDTINLDSSAPARRSFDVTTRARAQHRQPQKQQHDSKNWISFDEGTAQPMDNNEAWFLFLKQKRELQEQWQKGNYPRPTRPQHRSAPQEGRQRPKSSGASGRKESSNNRPVTDYIQHAPPQQQQQQQQQPADLLDGSLYELHHHGAVSSFSNGLMSSSRPRSATERSRPASVSARLHSAAIHNPSPPAAHSHSARFEGAPPSAGQHFNFSEATTEAMEAQDLSFQWPEQPQYGEVKIGQQIERLNTQHKVEPERKISGRARSAPRGGVRQSKAAAGVTQRRNKEQVIERLTAAYVNSVK